MSREILPLAELARAGACSAQLTSCAAEWPGGIPLTAESAWFKRARPWGAPLNAATHQRVRRSTAGKALPERRMQTEGDTMSNALKEARPERFDISVDSRGYVLVNGQFRIMANGNAVRPSCCGTSTGKGDDKVKTPCPHGSDTRIIRAWYFHGRYHGRCATCDQTASGGKARTLLAQVEKLNAQIRALGAVPPAAVPVKLAAVMAIAAPSVPVVDYDDEADDEADDVTEQYNAEPIDCDSDDECDPIAPVQVSLPLPAAPVTVRKALGAFTRTK